MPDNNDQRRNGDLYGDPTILFQPPRSRGNIGNIQPGNPYGGQQGYPQNQQGAPYGGQQGYPQDQQSAPYGGQQGYPQNQPGAPYGGQQGYPQNQQGAPYGGQQGYPQNQPGAPYGGQQGYPQNQQSAPYGGQQGYPQNQPSAPYGGQQNYRDEEPDNGGRGGMIALIVVICILIAAIAGVGLYLLLGRDKSSGSSSSSNNAAATTEATTEEVTSDTTEATEDTTASEVKKIRIPDVSELELYDAEQLLERLGFVVDTEYEFSDTVPKDKIISLSPEAGNEEDQGTRITIKLSKGAEKRDDITAPDVRGDSYTDAKEKLEKLGFKVSMTYEAGSPETKDQVISQSVPAKTVVPHGTSILIVVSDGTKSGGNDQSHRYGKVITEETDLNIRRSPDINSDIIGTAKKGSTVEILGEENGWFKISYNNGVGYVSMAYVIVE